MRSLLFLICFVMSLASFSCYFGSLYYAGESLTRFDYAIIGFITIIAALIFTPAGSNNGKDSNS